MVSDDVLPERVALAISDVYEQLAAMRKTLDTLELSMSAMWVLQVMLAVDWWLR